MKKFYITTAIDYVNDTIHIGHAFQKIAADSLARYYRLKIGDENVFFLTGTDEYGQKTEKAAKSAGITPTELVKKISDSDQRQQDSLNISYNRFIRTTDPDHMKVAQKIWKKVDTSGDIYLGEYSGLYCGGCEAYYTEDDLINGQCPFHPNLKIQKVTEENYFFRWSKYKDFLINYIKDNPNFIFPKHRANEMLEFAKNIKDIPISRKHFKWGIPVPEHPEQVIYVWFDALINYISGIGYLKDKKLFEKFWPADIHILGKDNLRWHSLLWTAMLKSSGIDLPKTIIINGFLNINGQKISKSLGNVIKPTDWIEKYGADAVRYYLLRYTVLTEDGDISEKKLIQAYNSDLANGLGNLCSRVAKLAEKVGLEMENGEKKLDPKVEKAIEDFQLHEALKIIWRKISEIDKKLNQEEPWKILDEKILKEKLINYSKGIVEAVVNLKPFLPETAKKILNQYDGKITSQPPLFPRIK